MFNPENARRRVAELGKLLGPILVRGCGPNGVEGEVYFTALTVREDTKLKWLADNNASTHRYQELLLRAKDKNGDRIWEDEELDDVLNGGIDPYDCAFIIGSMYAGDKYKRKPETTPGPFCKNAARTAFEDLDELYGPVKVPHLGEDGGYLDIFYRPNNGYVDCAINEIHLKHPHEFELRILQKRALTEKGTPMFTTQHLATVSAALEPKEIKKVVLEMQSPKFMSDEDRIRLSVASNLDPEPDLDTLKN